MPPLVVMGRIPITSLTSDRWDQSEPSSGCDVLQSVQENELVSSRCLSFNNSARIGLSHSPSCRNISLLFISDMRRFLLLTAFVLSWAGQTSGSKVEMIWATAGDTAILPCNITIHDEKTIEWTKEGPPQQYAFVYRDGCETFGMKSEVFKFRTNLFLKEMKTGNISLRISSVQLSDAGTYQCRLIDRTEPVVIKTLQLYVSSVSEPKFSFVRFAGDGVTVQCEAKCWTLEPQITFLDDEGNNIPPENPKRQQEASGCFTVRRNVTLPAATKRVTCRVNQSQTNQTRDTELEISVSKTSSGLVPWNIMGVTLFVLIVLYLFRYVSGVKCPEYKQPPNQVTTNRMPESHNLPNRANSCDDVSAEHQRELDELKSALQDKEKIIDRMTQELTELKAQKSRVVCQHGHPLIDNNPSGGNNQDLTPSADSIGPNGDEAPKKKASKQNQKQSASTALCRCRSESCPRPSFLSKIPRRNTMSTKDQNRFSPLADLSDDDEPLLGHIPTDPQK